MTSNYTESRIKESSYIKYKEERLTDYHILRRNCLLKTRYWRKTRGGSDGNTRKKA